MFLIKDLPIDEKYPDSCVYWLFDTRKHNDPMSQGYIGVCSYGVNKRLRQHKKASAKGSKLPVHRAITKYGEFLGVKVLLSANPEFCLLAEYLLRPEPNMSGTLNVAMGGVPSPTTGTSLSDATKLKIRVANSGENSSWYGKKHTAEHCLAMSESMMGENNHRFGKEVSDEVRDKISKLAISREPNSLLQYKAMTMADDNTFRGYVAWRAPNANKEVWLRAEEIFAIYLSKGGCGLKRLSALLDNEYMPSALSTISKKLRSGWHPATDETYQSWKQDYLLQKSTESAPRTFHVHPWENSSGRKSRHVWALAEEMYETVTANKGIGAFSLGKKFGLKESSVVRINLKLREGWLPSLDSDWLIFKDQYNQKQKELT